MADDIARKKDTGEPGNGGQFGSSSKHGSGLSLHAGDSDGRTHADSTLQQVLDAGIASVRVPGDPEVLVVMDTKPGGFRGHVLVPFDVDGLVDAVTDGRAGYSGRHKRWALNAAEAAAQAEFGDDIEAVDRDGDTWLRVPFDADLDETPRQKASEVIVELSLEGRDLSYDLQEHMVEYLSERD